jgi:hypothetical protein
MTYTFKLARRLAILRHFVVLIALALLAACEKDLTAPEGASAGSLAHPKVLQVIPRKVVVETSQRVRFQALAHAPERRRVPLNVSWLTTGGRIAEDGTFSSSVAGTFKVIGRGRGHRPDTSIVVVVPPPPDLVRFDLTPGNATIEMRATRTFTVTGYLSDGSPVPVGAEWSATGGAVDPSGVYTAGTTPGVYRIIATSTSGSLADTSEITVAESAAPPPTVPTVTRLVLSPGSTSLALGDSKRFEAFGRTSAGDSVAVTASFAATGGTITATGLYTAGPTPGAYRVIATSDGLADTAAVSISGSGSQRALARGFWNYPSTYCNSSGVTGSSQPASTSDVLEFLQTARKCNVRLVLVPARKFITTTGTNHSPFSMDSAKAYTDRLARVLVPDTLRKYDPYIIGFNLADDYGCAECWGGVKVTQSEIAAWASYVRQKIPGLRIGVRVEPAWVQSSPYLASVIDYAWAQYHTGKGDARTYFDRQASIARSLGIALAMGVNLKYCGGAGTVECTPTQLRTFMGMAAEYPDNCALLGWTYSPTRLTDSGMQDAWSYVLNLADKHPDVPCRRGSP